MRYRCMNCKGWFTELVGKWIGGWFIVDCPHCKETLATQTRWFELRTIKQLKLNPWELRNGNRKSKPESIQTG